MRSMPPASSPLAEMPVPAPPPMIGTRFLFISWKRSTIFSRSCLMISILSLLGDLVEALDESKTKIGIVDMKRESADDSLFGFLDRGLNRAEESLIRFRIKKRLPGRIER